MDERMNRCPTCHRPLDWRAPVPTSRQDISEALAVLADAAELLPDAVLAFELRKLSERMDPQTAEAVLIRAGLDPHFGRVRNPDGSTLPSEKRRSGRTSRMLAEAVALLWRGVDIELTANDPRASDNLVRQASDLAAAAELGSLIHGIVEPHRRRRWAPERVEFVDHHERARARPDLPARDPWDHETGWSEAWEARASRPWPAEVPRPRYGNLDLVPVPFRDRDGSIRNIRWLRPPFAPEHSLARLRPFPSPVWTEDALPSPDEMMADRVVYRLCRESNPMGDPDGVVWYEET